MSRKEISKKEYSILCQVLSTPEMQLLKVLNQTLGLYYDKKDIVMTKDYLYAIGDIPIALIAHLDTVHSAPPTVFFHDSEKGYIWTHEGLGADDRAGVFSILMLLKSGYRPSVIFLTQEERGGIGASAFIKEWPAPAVETNFLIELDRRGEDDAVYYECGNERFEKFITSFGFVTDWGTFSDISIIAPAWDRAAVNLSIGYFDEHSLCERLNYRYMFKTIERVKQILESYEDGIVYKFEPIDWTKNVGWQYFTFPREQHGKALCDCCDSWVSRDALTNVYDCEIEEKYRLCPECVERYVTFCKTCGRPILIPSGIDSDGLCAECRKVKGIDVKA